MADYLAPATIGGVGYLAPLAVPAYVSPPPTVTGVTVSPATASLAGGATIDFDWVVAGTNNPSQAATVTTTLGTINSAGVLTAPAATSSAQSGVVTVTSTQDPTKSGTATFTVAALASTVTSVTVTPAPVTLAGGATTQFSAVVAGTNSPSQAGTWSTTIGSISSSGLFTAPAATTSAQTGTVKFTSVQDSTKSGSAAVTVSAAVSVDTTGPVMQGAISFTKAATSISLTWPAASDASAIEYFVSKDGNAATSTGATLGATFSGLAPSSSHQFVVTARDSSNNPSSNSLTVTVTTSDAGTTYATYVEETFVDLTGVARANLTGMRWYVWAETGTTPLGAPIAQGNVETTDANGLCHFDISGQTSAMPGAPVRLGFTNDSGDPGQAGLSSWFGTVLAH